MKVVGLAAIAVRVAARPGSINSPSRDLPLHRMASDERPAWTQQFDDVDKHILIARCENGVIGYGETHRGAQTQRLDRFARDLMQCDLTRLPWARLPFDDVPEYDGFEALVLDLLGKAWEVPVHRILGGALRAQVEVSAWSGHRTPDDAAAVAAIARADGYRSLKLKCNEDDDVAAIAHAVADRTDGEVRLVFDANGRLGSLDEALAALRGLDEANNVAFFEDPLPHSDLDMYRAIRERCTTPLAVHVALGSVEPRQDPRTLVDAYAANAADGFNITAGMARFVHLAGTADLLGLPCWHGSGIDLGLLEAANLHAAAAAPGCTLPSDIFGRRIREHDLLVDPIEIACGTARVPDGPGLGVELDLDAVHAYTTDEMIYGEDPRLDR